MATPIQDAAILRYLQELETAIKQRVGVVPEDVLSDTRDFLLHELQNLREAHSQQVSSGQVHGGHSSDQQRYEELVEACGSPETIAEACERKAAPPRRLRSGNAPNWRIACTRCGRSAPAGKAGITRIGARSVHKYVMGWCQSCHRLRWMRLQRDLHLNNLTDQLGSDLSGAELRKMNHRPWTVVTSIVAFALVLAIALPLMIRIFVANAG